MDFVTRCFAARPLRGVANWELFFGSELAVEMAGASKSSIHQVEVSYRDELLNTQEPDSYYALMNMKEREFEFIFSDLLSVKVCSPDFHKGVIARGEGKLVRVNVRKV